MYQKIAHFIKYHNAVTIVFVMVFFGFGVSYAAIPEVRDSVYSSTETVVSVDNGLIASADLDNFNFNLVINSVTEDDKNYYADYSYQTLAIIDGVWQTKAMEKTLKVSKAALSGKDFGLYAAEELGEFVKYELSFLKRVQKLEKEKGVSQKAVAVAYSGLIGKLLNPKERIIMGYSPVIKEVSKQEKALVVHPPSRPSASVETSAGQETAVVAEPISTPAVETIPTTASSSVGTPTSTPSTPTVTSESTEPIIEEAASSTTEVAPSE
ncbi:MAG: hypothetical protein HYW79_02775 [Parcubacteria group bacterium]|nr:hypothetical protein [Parcubacteria group bacterium]